MPTCPSKPLNVLSLGAGVQSSCLAFLSKEKIIEPFDFAVFADVKSEPKEVYSYLDYLKNQIPFPVYVVTHGEGLTIAIENKAADVSNRLSNPPFYTRQGDEIGILTRQCTVSFKIDVIKAKYREILGYEKRKRIPANSIIQSIGISLDEITRMKVSLDKWIVNKFPLVDLRMNRNDCIQWLKKHGYEQPPRSACVFCPYHSNHEWRRLKMHDPEAFQEAIRIDELIRDGLGTESKLYVHQSATPLAEVDLTNDIDRGQISFLDECEGMCGN